MARSSVRARTQRLAAAPTIGIAIAVIYFAREVLIPLALALLLSFLLAPLVTRLERWKLRRVPSVLVVVLIVFAMIFAVGWVMTNQVIHLAENLPTYQDEIVRKVRSLRGQASGIGSSIERLGTELEKAAAEPMTRPASAPADSTTDVAAATGDAQAVPGPVSSDAEIVVGPQLPKISAVPGATPSNPLFTVPVSAPVAPLTTLASYLGLTLAPLGTAALVILFVIFMLVEREDLRNRMLRLVSRGKYTLTTNALDDAGTRISRYMIALSVVNGTYGLAVGAGLWLIGAVLGHGTLFPNFLLWGILCALLRFIPYIGPWIGAAFPLALALAVYPGFAVFVATLGTIILIELVSNNVMEPWLYGTRTGMSPLAILVAAAFWTWLWGPIGLLLSTPLTVCMVVIGKHVPSLRSLHVLLGDQPALPPGVSFYQRLVAGDREEAAKLATDYAAASGAENVPDDLMIPALRLARRDRRDEDLTPEAEAAIFDAMRSIIDKLVDGQSPAELQAKTETQDAPRSDVLVFGYPAHHEAEEIILQMLAKVVQVPGARIQALSTRTLPVEVEARIAREKPALVFVSLLPPGGLVQARYLCRRLRKRFRDLTIVVGYWGRARDYDSLLKRLLAAGASSVTTTLLQSRRQIQAILEVAASPLPDVESAPVTPAERESSLSTGPSNAQPARGS